MTYKLSFLIIGATLILSACGSDAEGYADDLCDCMEESGYTDEAAGGLIGFGADSKLVKAQKEMQACALPILKEMREELGDMDDDEKKEFMKEFAKAAIDTDCTDQLMDNVPWALVMSGFKSLVERGDGDFGFGFGGEEEKEEPYYEEDYE